jgi:hypothetical protein
MCNDFLHYLLRNMPTDITNSRRFAEMFRGRLKYVVRRWRRLGSWFIRSESGWTRAPFGEAERAAKTVVRARQPAAQPPRHDPAGTVRTGYVGGASRHRQLGAKRRAALISIHSFLKLYCPVVARFPGSHLSEFCHERHRRDR